jgi:CubicO group peptidase (beta-lactamase class C family)
MDRATFTANLFRGADQRQNFQTMKEIFPTSTMTPSPTPAPFTEGDRITLPDQHMFEGSARNSADFLAATDTMALLVLKDGKVVYENYADWGGADRHWMSMSVAKSFISATMGIAVDEGLIGSIEEKVTDYRPEFAGSAYDGVRIKDVLQMSSGAQWNEDYSDPESDIVRFATVMATGSSFDGFAPTLPRAREPGSFNLYNSTDTQVLGMVLTKAVGRSITSYMQEKLWHPLGMENPGYWITDDFGMEMAFGGLNATARDYAKIGELFRNRGLANGRRIVSEDWVKASVTPDAPHLMPGDTGLSDSLLGYGYQWWVPEGDEGEYSAIGVYNQFVYVNPTRNVTIVKLSANQNYGASNDEKSYREFETFSLLKTIAHRT